MNQRIIYSNASGGVSVVIPAPESGLSIDEIAEKDVPKGTPYSIVDISTIPDDRTFRNAWEKQINSIKINQSKAQDIKKNLIRVERDKRLSLLDIEFIKALESGDMPSQNQIKLQKTKLRDAPQSPKITAAKTLDELKALTLDDLL